MARAYPAGNRTSRNAAETAIVLRLLWEKRDEHSAITEFQKAIALAPGEPSFHLSLGRSLEQVGRVADAVKEYRVFLEMAPTAPDAAQLKTHVNSLAERVAKPPSER